MMSRGLCKDESFCPWRPVLSMKPRSEVLPQCAHSFTCEFTHPSSVSSHKLSLLFPVSCINTHKLWGSLAICHPDVDLQLKRQFVTSCTDSANMADLLLTPATGTLLEGAFPECVSSLSCSSSLVVRSGTASPPPSGRGFLASETEHRSPGPQSRVCLASGEALTVHP